MLPNYDNKSENEKYESVILSGRCPGNLRDNNVNLSVTVLYT